MKKTLEDRINDPNSLNPLFQKISNLANVHFARMTNKLLSVRTTIFPLIGGSVLSEMLDREPDPRRAKSKSVTKFLLGTYGGNIECWGSPSGEKFILITNGYRRSDPRFKAYEIIRVRKDKQTGLWFEYNETIDR